MPPFDKQHAPAMGDLRAVYYWWWRYSEITDDIRRGNVWLTEPLTVPIRRRRRYFKLLWRAVRHAGFRKTEPPAPNKRLRLSAIVAPRPMPSNRHMGIRQTVGANARRLRLGRKETQETVAHRAGIAVSFLSEIERGKRSAGIVTIESLAGALGVQVIELFRTNTATEAKGLPRVARGSSKR